MWIFITLQEFKKWLFNIATYLKSVQMNSSSENGKRMCVVFIILHLLYKIRDHLMIKKNEDLFYTLFKMLHLKPELSPALTFPDLNFIMSFIPDDHHKAVANFLVHFTNTMLPFIINNWNKPHWIYAIPIIHVLDGRIQSFDNPALTSNEIIWKDNRVEVQSQSSFKVSK